MKHVAAAGIFALWVMCASAFASSLISDVIAPSVRKLTVHHGLSSDDLAIIVNPERQELYLVKGGAVHKMYRTSTSGRGMGTRKDSYKTPWGTHRVKEKIGAGAESGAVFKGRENLGTIADYSQRGCAEITSRILWLDGEERGVNKGGDVDSHERYIYIHGTASEKCTGAPHSGGCILLSNADVIELFDLVRAGTLVEILRKPYRKK